MHNIWGLQGQEWKKGWNWTCSLPKVLRPGGERLALQPERHLIPLPCPPSWWELLDLSFFMWKVANSTWKLHIMEIILHGGLVHRWDSARNRQNTQAPLYWVLRKPKFLEYNSALPLNSSPEEKPYVSCKSETKRPHRGGIPSMKSSKPVVRVSSLWQDSHLCPLGGLLTQKDSHKVKFKTVKVICGHSQSIRLIYPWIQFGWMTKAQCDPL